MKKFFLGLLVSAPVLLGAFASADAGQCTYDNGTYALAGEIAMDGSLCQPDGMRKNLEITYPTSEVDMRYQKGLNIGEKNNYAKAIEYLLKAKKEYDGLKIIGSDKNGLINILLDLSYYYIKNKNYEEALRTANKILRIGVNHRPTSKSIALNNKGAALDSLGRMMKGKEYYEQALAIDYNFSTANDNLDYVNQLIYAVDRMYANKITSIATVDAFGAYDDLTREQATKYLADFTRKILKKKTDKTNFGGKFSPKAAVTNEEFVTAIGKLIYSPQKEYYSKAQEEGLLDRLTGDDYLRKDEPITRGDAAIILYRAYDTTLPNHMD